MSERALHDPDVRILHKDDLRALLEDAAEEGALKALAAVGIDPSDKRTPERIRTLMNLADGVDQAKREVWKTIGRGLCYACLLGIVAWVARYWPAPRP